MNTGVYDLSQSIQIKLNYKYKGILITLFIIGTWLIIFSGCISLVQVNKTSILENTLLVLLLTFLQTGLFISSHDASHCIVAPQSIKVNNFLGQVAAFLYAGFDFCKLTKKHHQHHKSPVSNTDPDYNVSNENFLVWYFNFMCRYISIGQLLRVSCLMGVLQYVFKIPLTNLLVFYLIPGFLSTLQLFYFGTYLPHKQPLEGHQNTYKANSSYYPIWLSFITCYHFGYHYEHHKYPFIPWWLLHKLQKPIYRST